MMVWKVEEKRLPASKATRQHYNILRLRIENLVARCTVRRCHDGESIESKCWVRPLTRLWMLDLEAATRIIHYEMHNPTKYINIIFFN